MIQKFFSLLDRYQDVTFELVRIYLGLALLARGIFFVIDRNIFSSLLPAGAPQWVADPQNILAVALVHIIGGFCISIGFWTRVATLAQIPVLLVAVFLSISGMFDPDQSFQLTSLVLFLLFLVLICGSGKWSIDHRNRKHSWQLLLGRLNAFRGRSFDLLRIYMGVALFIRGMQFIVDADTFFGLMSADSSSQLQSTLLLHYVALTHIFGGFMLMAGLLTRVAVLLQIPVLIGALVVTGGPAGLLQGFQGFELASLTLFLLLLLFLHGPGIWSADYFLFQREGPAPVTARTAGAKEILQHVIPDEQAFPNPIDTLSVPEPTTSHDSIAALRDDPNVVAQARYSLWGWLVFLANVTPKPKEIVFRDVHTGKTLKRSSDAEVIEQFRYR